MKAIFTRTLGVALAIAGLAVALSAQATVVNYSVEGWGPQHFSGYEVPGDATWGVDGYPGDEVQLKAYPGTLDLTPGTYIQQINTLLWTGYYTYAGTPLGDWDELSFAFSVPRNITIDTATASLSQDCLLEVNWDDDYLSSAPGSTASLYVQGYRVDITPLGVDQYAAGGWSGPQPNGVPLPSRDMLAQFVVTAVPEPTTMIAGALLLLPFGASTLRMLRKSRKA